jgi:hypothetical protein
MPKGRLRKPQTELIKREGRRITRVVAIAIQEDGKGEKDLVFATREDLRFNPDELRCGSYAYQQRPPRVTFTLDPENPKRAVDVRFLELVEQ